jgi:hypothetical protein
VLNKCECHPTRPNNAIVELPASSPLICHRRRLSARLPRFSALTERRQKHARHLRPTPHRAGAHPRALCSGLLHKTTSESAAHKPRERRDPSHELLEAGGRGVLLSPRSWTRAPPTRLRPCRSRRHRPRDGGCLGLRVRHAPARAGPGGDGAVAGTSGAHHHWATGAEQGCRAPLQPRCRPRRRPPCAGEASRLTTSVAPFGKHVR